MAKRRIGITSVPASVSRRCVLGGSLPPPPYVVRSFIKVTGALRPPKPAPAIRALKGVSIAEMAELRDTSEGTIEAPCAAVFRKADVLGRPQNLSIFPAIVLPVIL